MEPDVGRGKVENTNESRHAAEVVVSNETDTSASSSPEFSAEASPWSMMSASPMDWRNPYQTALSSPPTQSMVHEDGYDPNRIPSSVFADTPASPMDWSTASNESLFSIHMGNSFSGYQGVVSKAAELGTIEETNTPQNPFENFETKGNDYSPNLTTVPETLPEPQTQQSNNIKDKANREETKAASSISTHKGGVSPFERNNSIQNRLSNESAQSSSSKNRLSNESAQSSSSKNRLSNESSKSSVSKNRLSDGSTKSNCSFAFPVLVTDFRKSSSFGLKSDKKEEPKIEQKSEPPKPVTQEAVRRRCCSSFFPGWLRCC